jgi:hypothetical protein
MSPFSNLRLSLTVIVLSALLEGCSSKSATALGGGYEEIKIVHKSVLMEPSLIQQQLTHRDASGKRTLVWPWLRSDVFITNGSAVFLGDRSTTWSANDKRWGQAPRLYVVKSPEPPVEITNEVLRRWARSTGKPEQEVVKSAGLIGGEMLPNGSFDFYFEFNGGRWPGTDIVLDWAQIIEIGKLVRKDGELHKDPELHSDYIGERGANFQTY